MPLSDDLKNMAKQYEFWAFHEARITLDLNSLNSMINFLNTAAYDAERLEAAAVPDSERKPEPTIEPGSNVVMLSQYRVNHPMTKKG